MEFYYNPSPIFVFGSNREGIHGKGAAFYAKKFYGAIYGVPKGLQGNSYAIVTKELRKGKPKVTINEIAIQVEQFIEFVKNSSETYILSRVGCGLAGFEDKEIAPLFKELYDNAEVRERVIFPDEWIKIYSKVD